MSVRQSAGNRVCRTCRCAISICIRRSPGWRIISIHRSTNPSQRSRNPFTFRRALSYVTCGALQIGFTAAYLLFGLFIFVAGIQWVTAIDSVVEIYVRSVAFGSGLFVALTTVPVAAKWLLIGRFKAQSIPIWSFAYFRFWVVKTLMRTSPVAAFISTPLYNAYLRLMGARIGRNVMLRCQFTPVCTDLVTIGDNTIVNSETSLLGYRAQSNFIHMGPVTIGSNAFVGEGSVLDIHTAMGDNTQLGHASSLQSGQRVPDDKRYHGSPAVETSSDYRQIESKNGADLRGAIYVSLILATMIMIAGPAVMILIYHVWDLFCPTPLTTLHCTTFSSMSTPLLLAISAALFFGALGIGLAGVYIIPRLCMRGLRPDVTYQNFGFHYLLQSIIRGISNSGFFSSLFGDSSAVIWYMRYVGWNLNTVHQTGSNMGSDQKHDNPFLCNIGSGTMISDGLKMMNMQMSPTSFRLAESKIGDNNFLGNGISYPPNGRTGSNVLFGTKTLVPIDGPVRENVGLLGSPAFEIPRNVCRDTRRMCLVRRADTSRPSPPQEHVQFRHGLDLHRKPVGGSGCRVNARASRNCEHRSFRHLRVLWSQRGGYWIEHGLPHRARARDYELQATQAAARLDLRSVFLVA